MTTAELTTMLGWSAVINTLVLLLSTISLIALRSSIASIHNKLFGLDDKNLGQAYFQYLSQYKIAILMLNIVPYAALRIMGP